MKPSHVNIYSNYMMLGSFFFYFYDATENLYTNSPKGPNKNKNTYFYFLLKKSCFCFALNDLIGVLGWRWLVLLRNLIWREVRFYFFSSIVRVSRQGRKRSIFMTLLLSAFIHLYTCSVKKTPAASVDASDVAVICISFANCTRASLVD